MTKVVSLAGEPERAAEYVVLRASAALPAGLPRQLDGVWFDRARVPVGRALRVGAWGGHFVASPTGRHEVRDHDGAVAEVYEVAPFDDTTCVWEVTLTEPTRAAAGTLVVAPGPVEAISQALERMAPQGVEIGFTVTATRVVPP